MKEDRIKRIEIDWKDLFKPINGLETSLDDDPLINKIVIKPEIIPIIFVPGIMGSILKNKAKRHKVWDPDDKGFMIKKYAKGCSAVKRKKLLIGNLSHANDYLEVHDNDPGHLKKLPNGMEERGWGGVAWSFYGRILKALAEQDWAEPLRQCFDFPVYAFGYNWTASNHESGAKLADYINKVIDKNNARLPCKHVILVTHSMGGLVARSACKLHKAEDKVLGVVHGVQPATGSPAAYFRMKNGFEPSDSPTGKGWDWLYNPIKMAVHKGKGSMARKVLGKSGEEVTIIMANSPGALELLPTTLYKTNDGSGQWLHYTNRQGKSEDLPASDPYAEIYQKPDIAYRLVNPEWLGDNSNSKSDGGYSQQTHDSWHYYAKNLKKAKSFHDKLKDALHPETFQFFSTDINTADKVEIKCRRVQDNDEIYVKAYRYKGFLEVVDEKGQRKDLDDLLFISAFSKDTYKDTVLYAYTFAPPSGAGDGTVPDSSGRALKAKPTGCTQESSATVDIDNDDENWFDRQHDGIYNTKTAQHITFKAIENLCKTKIKREAATE